MVGMNFMKHLFDYLYFSPDTFPKIYHNVWHILVPLMYVVTQYIGFVVGLECLIRIL